MCIYLFLYIVLGLILLYCFRLYNLNYWNNEVKNWDNYDSYSPTITIGFIGFFLCWPVGVSILIIYLIWAKIPILINFIFLKLDSCFKPKEKINPDSKKITGYSIDEVNIVYDFLAQAQRAAGNQKVYIHYKDGSYAEVK